MQYHILETTMHANGENTCEYLGVADYDILPETRCKVYHNDETFVCSVYTDYFASLSEMERFRQEYIS